MKIFFSLVFGFSLLLASRGAGADQDKPGPLRTKVFEGPWDFFEPPPEPKAGEIAPRQDMKGYLKAAGIDLPAGGEAFSEPTLGRLTIVATDEVIKQVTSLIESEASLREPRQVRVFLGLAEFKLPADEALEGLTYERARALAGDSWRIFERTSLLSKFGQLSKYAYPAGNGKGFTSTGATKEKPSMVLARPNEQVEIELEEIELDIAKNRAAFDLGFRFDHGPTDDQSPNRHNVMEKIALRNGEPALLRATARNSAKGARATVQALIVCAVIIDQRGAKSPPPTEIPPGRR